MIDSLGFNFALILFLLVLITGAIWALDHYVLRKRRAAGVPEPWWIEYPKSFFPVILIVFLLRSFLVEPFKIPSGSMLPTLLIGDFILVNKFTYGIRIPVINHKVLDINQPQRGEVMVFRYPENPSLDYIKRVVGVPGRQGELPKQAPFDQRRRSKTGARWQLQLRRDRADIHFDPAFPGIARGSPPCDIGAARASGRTRRYQAVPIPRELRLQ